MYWGIGYAVYSIYCMWLIGKVNKINDNKEKLPAFLGMIPVINLIIGFYGTLSLVTHYEENAEVSKRQQSRFVDFYRKIKDTNPTNVAEIRQSILKHGYITKQLYNKYKEHIEKADDPIVNKGQVILDIMDEKPLPGLDDFAKTRYNSGTNEETLLKRKEIQ